MRKIHLSSTIGAFAVLAMTLAGCSATESTQSSTPETAGAVAEVASLTIGVPGEPPVFINAVLYTALAEGFFSEEGLNVTLRAFPTGADVARAVESGEIEGGLVATPGAVALRANGGEPVAIYGFEHPSYVIGTTDLSVTSCEGLKGKTIAVDAVGAPKAVALDAMLASCGLLPSDVSTIAPGGPQSVDAMIAQQVQLAVLHPDELAVVRTAFEASVVMTLASVQPLSHYTAIITTDSQIDDTSSRGNWVSVVRAIQKAIAFIYDPANLDAVAQIASDMNTRSVEINKGAVGDFLQIEFWPIEGAGLSRNRIEATIVSQVENGNIDAENAPTYEELTDSSLFDDATK
jgi:NitT/TauT family transport system substrate-binding protein